MDTYRVLGKTKDEILKSKTPRSSSRDYGQFIKGKDLNLTAGNHHFSETNILYLYNLRFTIRSYPIG